MRKDDANRQVEVMRVVSQDAMGHSCRYCPTWTLLLALSDYGLTPNLNKQPRLPDLVLTCSPITARILLAKDFVSRYFGRT